MDTLLAFLIASMLTLFFVRRYVKTLQPSRAPARAAVKTSACPRCGKPVPSDSAFCAACGAPMALWNVHRAAVQPEAAGAAPEAKGKPRPVINASLCIGCGSCVDSCPETGTLALVSGKAILAHPDRCKGHSRCTEVCPTSAITLAFGSALQTLRAPLVKEDFETNVAGVYIAGELSGMGLIKTAINEGRLAVDSVRRRLEAEGLWKPPATDHGQVTPPPRPEPDSEPYDLIIIGAGPAGLSASLTALQHGLRYLTLEQGEVASAIRNYPRHKFLMAEPTEMPLYGNLYIGDGTKESLLTVWEAIIANTGVRIQTQERAELICREGAALRVETVKAVYRARYVILALGKRGSPRKLGVPGEELSKVAYRLIEADTYQDQDLLVVGGGDSAVEAALAVSKGAHNRVTLSYRGRSFDRARERNRKALEEAEQQGRVRVLRESRVLEIRPASVIVAVGGATIELPNQFTFVLIGGEPPDAFLRKTGIEIVEKVISG